MPSERRYPRKGEYGDTRARCAWCGKPYERPTFMSERSHKWKYCSSDCSAAGGIYGNICCFIGLLIGILILIPLILSPENQASASPDQAVMAVTIVLILGFYVLCRLAFSINRGFQIRWQDSTSYYHGPKLYGRHLSPLQRKILDFVREFPANDGVERAQIEAYLQERGVLLSHAGVAIAQLIDRGNLIETDDDRYIVAAS